ncbi:carbohydrate ABC transporter permease [Clostridium sp. MCC353]|uniref:carbohydrate ABC transporter permease n=1 Tax=Clostridium sp. MCC353 TaxID=2592646 RepID=UPI0020793C53|nr:carbohydrate ABC transporter permease [Clostridium sp. MCC353]
MVKNKKITGDKVFKFFVMLFLACFSLLILYPIVWIISSSFSDPFAVMTGKVRFLPIGFTTKMYTRVFHHPEIWGAYKNTICYTLLSVTVSILLTSLAAYPLSRKDFFGKKFFTTVLLITMFFQGGMIPTFLLVKQLKMLDTVWAIVLPTAMSVYNTIVMRTFYASTIPQELEEAAFLDGANDIQFYLLVVIPLSKAIMAVMILFYAVEAWNSWLPAFLYMSSRDKYPLQLILREIIIQGSSGMANDNELIGDGLKYATMVVATLPIMCLYPWLQKYFTKGVMIGSVKG